MDFIDVINELATKIPKQIEFIQTEEATKSAFIMPFINALGYNVFDPTELVPEFTADVGIKKGEKVDYAIMLDGKPIMLFECKSCNTTLANVHASQLYRYFSVTNARIGILTNGLIYKFYTDVEESNKMDEKPFLEINMLDINEHAISELKKLSKTKFNENEIVSAASELKYTKEIKRILNEQLTHPEDDFVKFLCAKVYSGIKTQSVVEQFSVIVKKAFNQFISDRINERLKSAMSSIEEKTAEEEIPEIIEEKKVDRVFTTEEEMEGYHIVKSILRETIDPARIVHRDTQSYFGILLDDNNRKPICRLYFNSSKKYLALINVNDNKKEEKVELYNLNDIYSFSGKLVETLLAYEQ